jgi:hypothetical protein
MWIQITVIAVLAVVFLVRLVTTLRSPGGK